MALVVAAIVVVLTNGYGSYIVGKIEYHQVETEEFRGVSFPPVPSNITLEDHSHVIEIAFCF